jgi:CoA binding domain
MDKTPESVTAFLRGRRFAVAGVSRQPGQTANAVFRRLRDAGYEVLPINPRASEVEGVTCYSSVGAVRPSRAPGPRQSPEPGALISPSKRRTNDPATPSGVLSST